MINEFHGFINSKLIEIAVDSNDPVKKFYEHVLERFEVNLSAIESLLEIYKNNPKIKLSLGLILRAVNSDFLSVLYLATFPDKEKVGALNELNILQKDYVKSILDFGKEELALNEKYFSNRVESIEKSKFHIEDLHNDYPELFKKVDNRYALKTNSELRKSSPDYLFPELEDKKLPNGFISEAYRYKRLKLLGSDRYAAQAYLAFKYYSQFQHISPSSSRILEYNNKILDNKFLLMSIEVLIIGVNLILKVITGDGSKREIDIFINRIIKLVN
ncbi:MAG: hypothetical protein KDC52_00875 [Ignavibacteriae bacterium]|nr:hypothetical protein [Ignavibacteriota bacterium]